LQVSFPLLRLKCGFGASAATFSAHPRNNDEANPHPEKPPSPIGLILAVDVQNRS
jgi:hypothetical protein